MIRFSHHGNLLAYLYGVFVFSSLSLLTLIVLPPALLVISVLAVIFLLLESIGLLRILYPIRFSTELCDLLEQTALSSVTSLQIPSVWDTVSLNLSFCKLPVEVDIHSLYTPSTRDDSNVLLWIHGTGSSAAISFGMNTLFDRLQDTYTVYAIDLPGFGRSTAPSAILEYSDVQLEEFFIEVILAFMNLKGISNVFLVAHSMGGFFAINFAHK